MMLPTGSALFTSFTVESWFSTAPLKIAGANCATFTIIGRLLVPSTVTIIFDVFEATSGGTIRLICVSLLNRIFAGAPSKVTPTDLPVKALPMTEESDPGTTGTGARWAAWPTELPGPGGGGGAGPAVNVPGILLLPATGPASTTTVAV